MSQVIVIGGCGAVGSVSVRTLAESGEFDRVIIGDINMERADMLVKELGPDRVSAVEMDALDPKSIRSAIKGSDVVLNCSGPFYKYVKTILSTVIEEKINYVDVCDDVDVTGDVLAMDGAAKKAGISALIGMGSSPGVTNLLARFAADHLFDEIESVDIFHTHGGEPFEGEGVIAHRFHCMTIDIPMYLNGELKYMKFFEPDGIALREEVEFERIGLTKVYPYPHPEQVTIPKYISLKRVTNKGSVLPEEYFNLTTEMVRLGLYRKEPPLVVRGQSVVPYDFAVSYIIEQRDRILKELNFGVQRGAVLVKTQGIKEGKKLTYRFHMSSENQALGEGTGIPAALGAILMNQGKISKKGAYPPEGGVDPLNFLALSKTVFTSSGDGKSFEGFVVEKVDEDGTISHIDI